jgi:Protein of unknown function (DUF3224)
MTRHAEGSFQVTSWKEEPYLEIDDSRKLTRASVTQTFSGDIEGEGSVEWHMCSRPDGTADWLGFQRVVGRLGDRAGSFVVQTNGTFDGSVAKGDWVVVAGSGTEELESLRGKGRMHSPLGTEASYVLDYELD